MSRDRLEEYLDEFIVFEDTPFARLNKHIDARLMDKLVDGVGRERTAPLPDPSGVLAPDTQDGPSTRRRCRVRTTALRPHKSVEDKSPCHRRGPRVSWKFRPTCLRSRHRSDHHTPLVPNGYRNPAFPSDGYFWRGNHVVPGCHNPVVRGLGGLTHPNFRARRRRRRRYRCLAPSSILLVM